jgi:hypothetical protein
MMPSTLLDNAFPAPNEINLAPLAETRFGRACEDLSRQHQISMELTAVSLLAAISVAAQGRHDVLLPHGSTAPLSLYTLIVAESGEGKSAAFKKTMAPIQRVEREYHQTLRTKQPDYEAELNTWEAAGVGLKMELRKAMRQKKSVKETRNALDEHTANKPVSPRKFRLLYPDTTPAALFEGLQRILPTGALVTDEGDTYFKGEMRQARGHMNSLWGGEDLVISRATKEDVVVCDPRFGLHISIQPGILARHLKPEDRDSGWAARFIVCAPPSVRGKRQYHLDTAKPGESWQWADQRLEALVRKNLTLLENTDLPRQRLAFTLEAKRHWVQLANEIEKAMGDWGRFKDCPDHASKLTNQIGRVAALFHLFEDHDGDISLQTLAMAANLCSYYSSDFQRVLMPPPQEIQDAAQLKEWFGEIMRHYNVSNVPYNYVRKSGPQCIRDRKRLKGAIEVLNDQGLIGLGFQGRTRFIYFLNI